MAKLMICPTCDGKVSENSDVCPHCGENHFYRELTETRFVPCHRCDDGVVYRRVNSLVDHSQGFYAMQEDFSYLHIYNFTLFHKTDNTGCRCVVGISNDAPDRDAMIKAIKENNAELIRDVGGYFDLYYDPQPCPVCDGLGCIATRVVTGKVDIRKPAK